MERDGCGVGFLVSLKNDRSHHILTQGLSALEAMEHRGGVGPGDIGDGAGIMTGIPYELFNREPETFAVASLLMPQDLQKQKKSISVFEETFLQHGLQVVGYRDIPTVESELGALAVGIMPRLVQAIILRPSQCRTLQSFEKLLYFARQMTRIKEKENGISQEFYFSSLSARSIVYKALCRSQDLKKFYPDLQDPKYLTNFALFHRRFSTNTISTWDKVQPFRLIAHNGEINTIEGNRAWAITREKALGLKEDELITHKGISDSGNLNGIVEALRFRSSIPKLAEVLSILMPPANPKSSFYDFWGKGMEPWDGPAMVAYSDGKYIGARLDRNGFRPGRWMRTKDAFYLSSEAGVFGVPSESIIAKGALWAGGSVTINVFTGEVSFLDPKDFPENKNAHFDPQTIPLHYISPGPELGDSKNLHGHFRVSKEELDRIILPMSIEAKEPIGSMGDTSSLALLSGESRSFFDYFYQDFAQVTNPPIDYIREKIVTEMRVHLGRKPNIFEPKEFIPLKATFELESPVISLGQMSFLKGLADNTQYPELKSAVLDYTLPRDATVDEFEQRLHDLASEAVGLIKKGYSLLILSHRNTCESRVAIPSLLALSHLNLELNRTGRRLRTSLIMDIGDARNAHQVSCLLGFGASCVCPYVALKTVIESDDERLLSYFPEQREKRYLAAVSEGVLRIMAKRGISVFRSYQGSKLFTPVGLHQSLLDKFFNQTKSILGGLTLQMVLDEMKSTHIPQFLYKEQASGKSGELHSMTSRRARFIHKMLEIEDIELAYHEFKEFVKDTETKPILIRHLLALKESGTILKAADIPLGDILKTFGSGAMSFGALSAESQRDLIEAMKAIGGRSNSGEGGENPYYESQGITASIKQLASGRFGVTAEYLTSGHEVQIKIAQGAKPGEGGQLMGAKVTEEIAKARHTMAGIDLISPAPQHDIYSIEDLKELIYELKELKENLKISVKLVSAENIGAIAVGVVKAGADIIQISGGDGGTGAASLISMKHAGLPLEVGLFEVHSSLIKNGLRSRVILRADGGISTGKDILIASALGADEFDFGKLLLVGQGCIMARICEKNTCPAGIATHSPKFKAMYKGEVSKVVRLLECLAMNVREELSKIGLNDLGALRGRNDLLKMNPHFIDIIRSRNIDLSFFLTPTGSEKVAKDFTSNVKSPLNEKIIKELHGPKEFIITNEDRAIGARLSGLYSSPRTKNELPPQVKLKFSGSAGQGFGVFNVSNVELHLEGEANDSVAKGMSGGRIVVVPPKNSHLDFDPVVNTVIGNCALYGATGGTLFAHGRAGDRFAVRNSGATAIVEATGLHACEYMSGGLVWILGEVMGNLGAGMSGGVVYLKKELLEMVNRDYLVEVPLTLGDRLQLGQLEDEYNLACGINFKRNLSEFMKLVPIKK